MILLTTIARVADGLPLAASIQEDEQVRHLANPRSPSREEKKQQAKLHSKIMTFEGG